MNDIPQVNVKFPSKIEVDAPELDNKIGAMALAFQGLSDHLKRGFGDIGEKLEILSKMPKMLENVQKEMVQQFSNLFEQHIQSLLLARRANVTAIQKKKASMERYASEKRDQLNADNDRVSERYSKLLENVSADCQVQIRQLDSHALDLVEQVYPRQIRDRFSFDSTPAVNALVAHTIETEQARATCLDEGLQRAETAVESFVERRRQFYNDLDVGLSFDDALLGWYELPMTIVEITNKETGERSWVPVNAAEREGAEIGTAMRLASSAQRADSGDRACLDDDARAAIRRALAAHENADLLREFDASDIASFPEA